MAAELRKDSIDLGIVIKDSDASLAFYCGVLGFEHLGDTPMPAGMNGTMHRLMCGSSMIKLVKLDDTPATSAPPGGITGATGIRYFTMQVTNLAQVTEDCKSAGSTAVIDQAEIRPGVSISIVTDPDGNWVEFLQSTD